MKNKIDEILKELLAIDPSFAAHEQQMRQIIAELLAKKPDTRLDEQFVARLRAQLQNEPVPSPFMWSAYLPYAAVAVLAVLVMVPFGYYASQQNSGTAVFAMNQQIEHLQSEAYGSLQSPEGGKGGGVPLGTEATRSYSPVATMIVGTANGASENPVSPVTTDAKMIMPVGPITTYSYIYKGDPLELSETEGLVYRKVQNKNSSGQIATQLRKFNFGLMNLGAYTDARVRSFELVEDKPFGYSINVNFDEGMISINANYTEWPSMSGKDGSVQQLPASAMPKNDEVLAIAQKFLEDHDISTANFADPVVQDYSQMGIAATEMQFAPEQVTVTYPLKISGTPVFEDGAYPYGLQVGISVKDKRVMSVYGLSAQTYTSSSYQLETDTNKILSIAGRGGVNAWVPDQTSGVEIKKVEAELGTPQKILMHTYSYSDGDSKELFVPALSFPVTKAPAGEQYYPKYIVIPLVPELLTEQGQRPVIYDMMR